MGFKKQYFNGQELAMLFQAFGKKPFVRPIKDDIYSLAHDNDEWIKLKNNFLNAISVKNLEEDNLSDYVEKVGQYWM